MKLKALKPTENMTANQIRPFIKKKAKPPIAKYLPYLFFDKIFLNFDKVNPDKKLKKINRNKISL